MTLFVTERRRAILEKLKNHGRVSVKELSDELDVSAVTIRQDLRSLEEDGQLERTYGGAVPRQTNRDFPPEMPFDLRNTRSRREKDAIGIAAGAIVKEGYRIALDASTTAYAIVPYLKRFAHLTIVTNNLVIAQSFPDKPEIEVFIPGGRLRKESISIVGQPEAVPNINLNVGFFGASGISLKGGMSDFDPNEIAMKQAMIARCEMPVIIVDGSKWDQIAPYTVLPSEQIRYIITTDDAPADLVDQFRQQGTHVELITLD